MAFHVRVRPALRARVHEMIYAINLDQDELRTRFLDPYELGKPLTSGGRTIASAQIEQVLVFETDGAVSGGGSDGWQQARDVGKDRTDDFIVGAPGGRVVPDGEVLAPGIARDPSRVMIVH